MKELLELRKYLKTAKAEGKSLAKLIKEIEQELLDLLDEQHSNTPKSTGRERIVTLPIPVPAIEELISPPPIVSEPTNKATLESLHKLKDLKRLPEHILAQVKVRFESLNQLTPLYATNSVKDWLLTGNDADLERKE